MDFLETIPNDETNLEKFIFAYGAELFGTPEAFWKWMNCEIMALGGKKPKDIPLIDLYQELGRIEHGIY